MNISDLLSNKMRVRTFCLVLLFTVLILLPVRIGTHANDHIFGVRYIENISQKYCNDTLLKATAAYGVAKVINKSISTIQNTEVHVSPAGLGVTLAPGEILAAANDGIEMVSSALFVIIGILLVQKMTLGAILFLCLKLLFPVSIILILLNMHLPNIFPWGKRLAVMLAKMAFIIFLFFPLSALVSNYVESAFVDAEYENVLSEVNIEADKLEQEVINEDVDTAESLADEEDSEGWFKGVSSGISNLWGNVKNFSSSELKANLTNQATKILEYADNMIDKLFIIFSMFVLTVIIIPISVFYIFITLMRFFIKEAELSLLERQERLIHDTNPQNSLDTGI